LNNYFLDVAKYCGRILN